jgi:C4-type Zn-finger protein
MTSTGLRLWIDAVRWMEADPGTPVTCPVCDIGTLIVEDILSEANPEVGTRTIRCTHCGHYSTSRYRFGPQAVTSGVAAK